MRYRDYKWREIITTNRYGAEWIVRNVPQLVHETGEVNERFECLPVAFPIQRLNDEETAVVAAMRKGNCQKAVEIILSKED